MLRHVTNFEKSDAYRARIHDLIPGGAHTYSKGDDQFPARAPAAIDHGKGSHVWDIDGNEYLDCSMGLTSVSLGHAYEPVIRRAAAEMEKGVNFQRPSRLELEFAERFLKLVPSHQMVKLGKNGSTVTTAAVKIARGYTGRKLVAFPGDHPFYSYDDWFIGKSPCNLGIPEEIQNLSVTFKSYDIESLRELFSKYPGQIACVITEPEKNFPIPPTYLKDAIELAHKDGALFIVDEMITGFKSALPGSMKKFGINPDMATWGKGMGNGFSVCALTGTREVMELGGIRRQGQEKLFLISTTHGAETHALAAGLAVLDEFEKHDVVGHNLAIGRKLIAESRKAVSAANLDGKIEIVPCEWQPLFIFKNQKGEADNGYRTLMLQEMIARGVLFQGIFSPCFSHDDKDIEYFVEAFKDCFTVYKKALSEGFEKYLIGEPTKPVFRKTL
jgi:glutamate-1-semialdehyde aminotransferase